MHGGFDRSNMKGVLPSAGKNFRTRSNSGSSNSGVKLGRVSQHSTFPVQKAETRKTENPKTQILKQNECAAISRYLPTVLGSGPSRIF